MESGGRIRLVAVLPLVGAMALPGDPWGRVQQVGRFSLFSGSQEKQHLPHKEPPYAEESEAGHSKGPYLLFKTTVLCVHPALHDFLHGHAGAVCPDPPFLGAGVWQ